MRPATEPLDTVRNEGNRANSQGGSPLAYADAARATERMPVVASRAHSAREGLAVLELRLGNTEEGERRVAELTTIADEVPTAVTRASAANAQGWLDAFAGNLEAAVQPFTLCRDLAIGADDWAHEVNARLGLAWVQPGINRIDAAAAEARCPRHGGRGRQCWETRGVPDNAR